MIKADTKEEAFDLARDLLNIPKEALIIRERKECDIYYDRDNDIRDEYIYDFGDRIEVEFIDGSRKTILIEENIEENSGITAYVGLYWDRKIFGEVSVKDVREMCYEDVVGFQNKILDDGRPGLVLSFSDRDVASFGVENVAYVRLE